MAFESLNDDRETLTPGNAEKIFRLLFDQEVISKLKFDKARPSRVEVFLVPDDNSLRSVLAIPAISTIEMYVALPNMPDDSAEDADDIIARLKAMKARSQKTIIKAENSREGLELDAHARAQAEAASLNGYVNSEGRGDDGKKLFQSTRQYPRKITEYVESQTSTLGKIIDVVKNVRSHITGS